MTLAELLHEVGQRIGYYAAFHGLPSPPAALELVGRMIEHLPPDLLEQRGAGARS